MKQTKIKKKADKIKKKLKLHRRETKRVEQMILDDWKDLQDECDHPDLKGHREGYCPDCGYTFG